MSQSFVSKTSTLAPNSSITERRTIITSSSSSHGGDDNAFSSNLADDGIFYKSSITPRHSSINRSSIAPMSPARNGSTSYTRVTEMSSGFGMPSMSSNTTAPAVNSYKSTREREKKDMQDLNERFANYIEKVRFLEAQNKKLVSELDQLRSNWGKETSAVKQMFATELEEARKTIDDTSKEKDRLQLRVSQLEDQFDDSQRQLDEAKKWRSQDRDTINKLNQQLSELEAEIRMLRRTNDSLDAERLRDKQTIARLQEEIEKLRIDLSNETIARLDAENKYQTLLEEIEFLKSVHEQELKELSALAYRDTTAENREFWKNELSQAIRDIQQEYDIKVDQIRGEMESFYNLKVQEFRTGATKQNMEVTHAREETKKLQKMLSDSRGRLSDLEARNGQLEKQYQDLMRELEAKEQEHMLETNSLKDEMNKLRAEMEGMLVELQTLMDAKLSLELEIAAYRKLLEHEESRAQSITATIMELADKSPSGGYRAYRMSSEGNGQSSVFGSESSSAVTFERSQSSTSSSSATAELHTSSSQKSIISETSKSSESAQKIATTELQKSSQKTIVSDSAQKVATTELQKSSQKTVETVSSNGESHAKEIEADSQLSMKMMRGEVSAKTTYQRTANGPVSIAEANPEGKFVMLENNPTGGIRKELNLDGWKIKRVVDNNKRGAFEYTFRNFSLKPNKNVKIYSRSQASQAGPNDLVFRESDTWGSGSEVVTTLINDKGEEKASHIQRTNYSQ